MEGSATATVVERIADEEGTNPIELPSMWEAIDTGALDAIVRSADGDANVRVEFEYYGYDVVVSGDGVDVSKRTRVLGEGAGRS